MSMMTSLALEELLCILLLEIMRWISQIFPPSELSMICILHLNKKCYDTPSERYDEKRNGWFPKLLSLDMLYPQIISHCIDDDEIRFWSSDVGIRYWIVCLVYCYLWICCIHR